MYLDFYLLKKEPFHVTPDPDFLFLSPSHKAALRALVYGVEERQGFVALLGEVGLGKTTILRSYLERVDQSQLKTIYLIHSKLSFRELLHMLCQECGLEGTTENVAETITRLHHVLVGEYQQGRNVALLVDEAQHMPLETLEQLLLLSNLETSTQKLLQIVLVGQPEFEAKLNAQALRQLKQRLVIRATIVPLTAEESRDYILYRLAKVRLADNPIFTPRALKAIVTQAQGIPRVLNILCTNALILGFVKGQPRISVKIAQEAIAEYTGKKPRQGWRPWVAVAGALALLQEVIAEYTGKKPRQGWRPWVAVAGALALLAVWHWGSPYALSLFAKLHLPRATLSGTLPETPAGGRDSGPLGSASTPFLPLEAAFPPPEPSAFPQMAPVDVRIIQKGDRIAQVAREVYGVSNPAVFAWIKQNNPHLQNVNRLKVGMQLTFPPLPSGVR
jgi:general secretion pathway protein A